MFRLYRNWLALLMLCIHKEIFEDKRKVSYDNGNRNNEREKK